MHHPPDVVVFDLAKRPSHSRETAGGIRGYKAGRTIPIVFLDGTEEDIAKTKAKVSPAMFSTSEKLVSALDKMGRVEISEINDTANIKQTKKRDDTLKLKK